MNVFYYDTDAALVEIFKDHCNLSGEQYEEIRAQFIYLVADFQDSEPQEEIEKRIQYMTAVFEFLYNTKELTLKEHYELGELLEKMQDEAQKAIVTKVITEGTVL